MSAAGPDPALLAAAAVRLGLEIRADSPVPRSMAEAIAATTAALDPFANLLRLRVITSTCPERIPPGAWVWVDPAVPVVNGKLVALRQSDGAMILPASTDRQGNFICLVEFPAFDDQSPQ